MPQENLSIYFWPALFMVLLLAGKILKLRAAYVLASACATLFLVDLGILLQERLLLDPWKYTYTASGKYQKPHPRLRVKHIPDSSARVSKRFRNGEYAFREVLYEIDSVGRRTTSSPPDGAAVKHALFFGGSFTFGMGLPTEGTLPSAFVKASGGEFHAYNYGMGGCGPSQMYLMLKNDAWFRDVTPPVGIGVYSFIPDHLGRATPYQYTRLLWIPNSPLFRLDENNALVGPFYAQQDAQLAPLLRRYRILRDHSPLLRQVFRIHEPSFVEEREAVDIVVRLVQESATLYYARFNGSFYVLIWPRLSRDFSGLDRFVAALQRSGIQVLRVPEMPEEDQAQIHPMDTHPSAAECAWVAEHLLQAL